MKLTEARIKQIIKEELEAHGAIEESGNIEKMVSPEILKGAQEKAKELKDSQDLNDAIKKAALEISKGDESMAQLVIPLIKKFFAES